MSGVLAAYFAWQTYRRKPELRITLLEDSLKRLRTYRGDGGYFGGQIILRVENPGKIVAKNVVGWLKFDHEHLVPHPADEGFSVDQNQQVTVQIPSIAPNPLLVDNTLFQVGKELKIRVETKQSGQTKILYRLVSDDGAHIENVLSVTVPSLGGYSEQQLIAFLKAIRDNPRKWTKSKDLETSLRSRGQDVGLSEIDLRRILRDALDKGYICEALEESSDHFLAIRFNGERFHVPQCLQLSVRGELCIDDHSQS